MKKRINKIEINDEALLDYCSRFFYVLDRATGSHFQKIYHWFYFNDEKTYESVAEMLDISIGTLRNHVERMNEIILTLMQTGI